MALGDHIKVRRAGGLYTHHGIDMGDGTVVHFSGDPVNFADAVVCRVSMEDFLQGESAVRVIHRGPELAGEDAARMAEERIGERGYHPLTNNCEHFATHCRTGRRDSAQSRRFVRVTVAAGFAALAVGAHLVNQIRERNGQRGAQLRAGALQQPNGRLKRS